MFFSYTKFQLITSTKRVDVQVSAENVLTPGSFYRQQDTLAIVFSISFRFQNTDVLTIFRTTRLASILLVPTWKLVLNFTIEVKNWHFIVFFYQIYSIFPFKLTAVYVNLCFCTMPPQIFCHYNIIHTTSSFVAKDVFRNFPLGHSSNHRSFFRTSTYFKSVTSQYQGSKVFKLV